MNSSRKSFQKLEGVLLDQISDVEVDPDYKEIKFHIIFDINMHGKFLTV